MDNTAKKVAKILLEINAVTLNPKNPYRYSSGILSPVYTDCRTLISYPEQRKIIRDLYVEKIKETGNEVEVIAGTATAGIPHAAWVADQMNLPMVYVRGKAKEHGKKNQIEGVIKKGQKVIVVEDLISTGESSIETANALEEAETTVLFIIAITTYEMKRAEENFNNSKLKLITLTTFTDIVNMAEDMGYIKEQDKQIILDWVKDPAGWSKKMGFE